MAGCCSKSYIKTQSNSHFVPLYYEMTALWTDIHLKLFAVTINYGARLSSYPGLDALDKFNPFQILRQ